MTTVIDASVVVKLLVRGPGAEAVQTAFERGGEWIAPDWLMVEVASASSRKIRLAELSDDQGIRAVATASPFVERFVVAEPLLPAALALLGTGP